MSLRIFSACTAIALLASVQTEAGQGTYNWYEWNGHQYAISTQLQTWDEAQAVAESMGGNLVVINSAEEEAFLQGTLLAHWPGPGAVLSDWRRCLLWPL